MYLLEQTFMNWKMKFIMILIMINMVLISTVSNIGIYAYQRSMEEIEDRPITTIDKSTIEPITAMVIDAHEIKEKVLEDINSMVEDQYTIKSSRNVHSSEINEYTDLSKMNNITVDDMNRIIDHWISLNGIETFKGQGQSFIDASKASGLDPVYILAHAALESSWGSSQISVEKNNYFGIGAFDHDPYNQAFIFTDPYTGIVEGAKWISENYYNKGQTCLYTMRYSPDGANNYCTSETWVYSITDIIQSSYSILEQQVA